jgi:hypothetical protein
MEGRGRWRGAPLPFLFQREPDRVGDELPEVRHVGTAIGARHHTEQLVDGSEGGRLLRRGDFAAVEAVLAEDPVVELPAQVRQPAAGEDVLPGRLSPGGDDVDRRIHHAGHAKEAHSWREAVAG